MWSFTFSPPIFSAYLSVHFQLIGISDFFVFFRNFRLKMAAILRTSHCHLTASSVPFCSSRKPYQLTKKYLCLLLFFVFCLHQSMRFCIKLFIFDRSFISYNCVQCTLCTRILMNFLSKFLAFIAAFRFHLHTACFQLLWMLFDRSPSLS